MFEKEESLPSAQSYAALDDGNDFAGAGENHANVGGHVIWALVGVDEVWGIFWDEVIKKGVEVSAGAGIGIFHDDEAGAGVLDKDGHGPSLDPCLCDSFLKLMGDFIGSFP